MWLIGGRFARAKSPRHTARASERLIFTRGCGQSTRIARLALLLGKEMSHVTVRQRDDRGAGLRSHRSGARAATELPGLARRPRLLSKDSPQPALSPTSGQSNTMASDALLDALSEVGLPPLLSLRGDVWRTHPSHAGHPHYGVEAPTVWFDGDYERKAASPDHRPGPEDPGSRGPADEIIWLVCLVAHRRRVPQPGARPPARQAIPSSRRRSAQLGQVESC